MIKYFFLFYSTHASPFVNQYFRPWNVQSNFKFSKHFFPLIDSRAALRPMEGEPVQKVRREFIRIDSLEGDCQTFDRNDLERPDQQNLESLKQNMDLKQPPTKAEKKWFDHHRDSHYTPPYSHKSKLIFSSCWNERVF